MSDSLVTLRVVSPDEKTKARILDGEIPLFVKFGIEAYGHCFVDKDDPDGLDALFDYYARKSSGNLTDADILIDQYIEDMKSPQLFYPSYSGDNLTAGVPYEINLIRSMYSALNQIVSNKADTVEGYLTVSRENTDWFIPIIPKGSHGHGTPVYGLELLVDKRDLEKITAGKPQIPADLTPEIIHERQLTDARQWLKENPKANVQEAADNLRKLSLPIKGINLYRLLVEFKKMVDRGDQLGLLDRATDPAEKKRIRNRILKRLPKTAAPLPKKEEK